ncbi:CAP domain-containing protein [Stutzerimonas chloritidismutans]|uniref:CAP domain-containing protein n=1 Tax=Stutzerimonas chloritidismutans TaxID=203192 RepID=UPI003F13C773
MTIATAIRRSGAAAAGSALGLALTLIPMSAHAAPADDLVSQINAFRGEEASCSGEEGKAVAPLAPNASLDLKPATTGAQLQQRLQASGYRPAKLQAISISGPASVQAAMSALRQRYCEPLRSQDYAEIGVAHEGNTWQILLAKPLLPPDLGDWKTVGQSILERVNAARSQPRRCGDQAFEAAPALGWSDTLADAALAHSQDMARRDYFSHRAPNGEQAGDRARQAGYRWSRVGENIAAGQGSAEQVVAGWLASPGHCANIMNADFTEMGAAYATDKASTAGSYWTQVFATPR